ncbi:HAD family hydrolase [Phenylobacterium koreense]|uniref:Hydrolase of the HAD superfamily n=1 Tax=Phenylobacterium koreense TaxID=266125 RepID=A0ABV2ELY5_9CAUL
MFDADGVFQRPPIDLANQLAHALGVAPHHADTFILELFAAEAMALTGENDVLACAEPVLTRWSIEGGIEPFNHLWHQIDVHSEVLDVVEDLRATGQYCAIASNQQARRARAMSVGLSYREKFDAEFYSCDLGLKKPMGAYFHRVVERCGFEPSRMLFVDDRAANLAAASALGIHTLHFVAEEHAEKGNALRAMIRAFEESL